MRDLARKVRKHASELGIEIEIQYATTDSKPIRLVAIDTELGGRQFEALLGTRSTWIESARRFHEWIYKERGREKFKLQKGICALCGKKMSGDQNTEIDHESSRGAHGRNDRMENLRVVHTNCHRQRHGERLAG